MFSSILSKCYPNQRREERQGVGCGLPPGNGNSGEYWIATRTLHDDIDEVMKGMIQDMNVLSQNESTYGSAVNCAIELVNQYHCKLRWHMIPENLSCNERVALTWLVTDSMTVSAAIKDAGAYIAYTVHKRIPRPSRDWLRAAVTAWPAIFFFTNLLPEERNDSTVIDALCNSSNLDSLTRYDEMVRHAVDCLVEWHMIPILECLAMKSPRMLKRTSMHEHVPEVMEVCQRVLRVHPKGSVEYVPECVRYRRGNVEFIMDNYPDMFLHYHHVKIHELNFPRQKVTDIVATKWHALACARAGSKSIGCHFQFPNFVQRSVDYILYMAEHQSAYSPNYIPNNALLDLPTLKKLLAFYPHSLWYHLSELASLELWAETCIHPLYIAMTTTSPTLPYLPLDLVHTIVDMCLENK